MRTFKRVTNSALAPATMLSTAEPVCLHSSANRLLQALHTHCRGDQGGIRADLHGWLHLCAQLAAKQWHIASMDVCCPRPAQQTCQPAMVLGWARIPTLSTLLVEGGGAATATCSWCMYSWCLQPCICLNGRLSKCHTLHMHLSPTRSLFESLLCRSELHWR